jgi:uncharacterized protein (TIGR00730 family)
MLNKDAPDSPISPGDSPPRGSKPPLTLEEYVLQIKQAADKLLLDQASRGDAKLMATAVKELRYALKVFAQYKNQSKITVFGSARIPQTHPSYHQCVTFSQQMAANGYLVVTGAAGGIMEAGHVGAGRQNSIGVNILLPFEQAANSVIAGDAKLVHLKYFFTRKLMLIKESHAVAVFPGGFGTHDETFEVLTLMQTGKATLMPVVLLEEPGGDYWKHWLAFAQDTLLSRKYISPSDLALFKITESPEVGVAEILKFYRIYHSMRYIGDHMVMRLKKELAPELLAQIATQFSDLVKTGTFEQVTAHPAEQGEEHIIHLPRLRFSFNRRLFGRLRQLIDFINEKG